MTGGTLTGSVSAAPAGDGATALLLIDIQDFYYPGSPRPLLNPEAAGMNAAKLLNHFRKKKMLVVHVRHNAKQLAGIHKSVTPLTGEKVISKDFVNSFHKTDLLEYLNKHNIKQLIVCGMMTHMCVEGAVRAGADLGFKCTVIHDACTTRDLTFNKKTVKAEDVHNSTLSTLAAYAKVLDTETILKERK
ncbi:MAG: cysteine hydrolase [bacterium]|nr:cysteine hydrolase [bacterium]